MKLNDIWICLGLPMVLFVMPKPLSVGLRYSDDSARASYGMKVSSPVKISLDRIRYFYRGE
jgi:hypothetical protein